MIVKIMLIAVSSLNTRLMAILYKLLHKLASAAKPVEHGNQPRRGWNNRLIELLK